jgi:hypothetical protein
MISRRVRRIPSLDANHHPRAVLHTEETAARASDGISLPARGDSRLASRTEDSPEVCAALEGPYLEKLSALVPNHEPGELRDGFQRVIGRAPASIHTTDDSVSLAVLSKR